MHGEISWDREWIFAIFSGEQFGFLHFESLQIGQNALQHLPALLQPLLRNISRLRFLG